MGNPMSKRLPQIPSRCATTPVTERVSAFVPHLDTAARDGWRVSIYQNMAGSHSAAARAASCCIGPTRSIA